MSLRINMLREKTYKATLVRIFMQIDFVSYCEHRSDCYQYKD